MLNSSSVRVYVCTAATLTLTLLAAPASAQYRPRIASDPATGEKYHIEVGAGFWFPKAEISVTSEGFGIAGTTIDAKKDLGLSDQRFPELQVVLRPSRSQKLRLQYIPIKYDQTGTPTRTITFNGQNFDVRVPVNSTLDWKAYRFAYEYDFVVRDRGFVGFLIEAKYTDVRVELDSQFRQEFAHARAPIPALGGIGRFYVVPNISITGEVTGFKIPDSIDSRYNAHYVDVDIYGTVNFTNNVGVKAGYRSLDLGYLIKNDQGSFVLKGLYFGAVLRY